MGKVLITEEYLEDIGDALRDQLGTTATYTPPQMAGAIRSISGGASDWDDIENKPFETIGDGLEVNSDGELCATGGGSMSNVISLYNVPSPLNITDAQNAPLEQFILENNIKRGPTTIVGKNHYNPALDTSPYYISSSGVITDSTTVTDGYSELIACTPGDNIYYYGTTSPTTTTRNTNKRLHGYDANGNWVRQISYTTVPSGSSSYTYRIATTIPSNVYYVRISHSTDETDVMVEFGTETHYEPFNGNTPFLSYNSLTFTLNSVDHTINAPAALTNGFYVADINVKDGTLSVLWDCIQSYNGETLPGQWMSSYGLDYGQSTPSTGAQVLYELATPVVYNITPEVITLLANNNTIAVTDGFIKAITYYSNSVRQGTLIADTSITIGQTSLTESQLKKLLVLINA